MRTRVLVIAQQTAVRAAVARVFVSLEFRIELASSERMARQLIRKEQFDAAVVAASENAAAQINFLRELEDAVGKLVILTDNKSASKHFAESFPDALVCSGQPLELTRCVSFVGDDRATAADGGERVWPSTIFEFERCTLDLGGHIFLDANGNEVTLTRGEFSLVVAFVTSPGRVLSRAELRRAVSGGRTDSYDRSVDMLVARLRRKIEPRGRRVRFIETVPGVGYKFIQGVRVSDAAAPIAAGRQPTVDATGDKLVERRQLTVLSCQILGMVSLASDVDPEDLQRTIGDVYGTCAAIVGRYGGTMERALGDGVVVYFGHPKATEHDAEGAVRAALDLVGTIGSIEAGPIGRYRARIGVATGLMLVGGIGTGHRREVALPPIGAPLNLAQQLRQAAPAGGVVVAASTRKLLGRRFDCRELEPVMLDDGGETVPAFEVREASAELTRFDALRRDGMPPLVGRTAEIERLMEHWSRVRRGAGQVVLLSGEPGIGKSRLGIELQRTLRQKSDILIRCSGSPYRSESPMAALLDAVQRAAGLAVTDSVEQKLHKLNAAIAVLDGGPTESTALIAGLLGLPCEIPSQIRELSPQKRKERVFAALLDSIERATATRALLVVVEDAHWLDPTSLEFLALLVERAGALRLLLLMVARPDFMPPWPEYSYVSTLTLSRLSRADSALLIHEVAGEQPISAALENTIVSRADGVPLFLEELTKAMLEWRVGQTGALKQAARREPAIGEGNDAVGAPIQGAPIPTTLQGLLLARFDRLERAKETAQAAAAIGREFSYELLRLVAGFDDDTLMRGLDRLVTSGLVFRRGSPPQATFVFKHALVRDAAYETLVRERRQALHAAVARAYEERFLETVAAQPELLAHHWHQAGYAFKAVEYLIAAADRALLRSAATEALTHLTQARDIISTQPENRERLLLEIKTETTLGRVLIERRGYTAAETRESYSRALALCNQAQDENWLPLILLGHSLTAWFAADYRSTLKDAHELYAWGERNNESAGRAVAHLALGMSHLVLGNLVTARHHLEQGLQINRFVIPGHQHFLASDTDGRCSSLSYLHDCLLLLGLPDQADAAAKEAALLKPNQLYSRALAQVHNLRMQVLKRDAVKAVETGPAVLRLCQEQGYPYFAAISMVHTGWALALHGEVTDGTELCRAGLSQLRAFGPGCSWLPRYLALLAECYECAGEFTRGAETLEEAHATIDATDERVWEPEIYRIEGRLLFAVGNADTAQERFVAALRIAREQKLKLSELRASVNLADLMRHEGRPTEAREVLAPVYSSFTEGFDFIDLREAKAILDTLSSHTETSPKLRRRKRSSSAA